MDLTCNETLEKDDCSKFMPRPVFRCPRQRRMLCAATPLFRLKAQNNASESSIDIVAAVCAIGLEAATKPITDSSTRAASIAACCLSFMQFLGSRQEPFRKCDAKTVALAAAVWYRQVTFISYFQHFPRDLLGVFGMPVPTPSEMRSAAIEFPVAMFKIEAEAGLNVYMVECMLRDAVADFPLVHTFASDDIAFNVLCVMFMHLCACGGVVLGEAEPTLAALVQWAFAAVELSCMRTHTAATALVEGLRLPNVLPHLPRVASAVHNQRKSSLDDLTTAWVGISRSDLWCMVCTNVVP